MRLEQRLSPPCQCFFMDRRQDAPRISLFYIYFLIYLIFRPKGPLAPLPAFFLSLSSVSLRILHPRYRCRTASRNLFSFPFFPVPEEERKNVSLLPSPPPSLPTRKSGRAAPAARSQREVRHGSEAHPEGGGGSGRQDPGLPEDSRGAHPGSGGNIGYIRK